MNTNAFIKFHPLVNFIYFVFIIGFSCIFMHPIFLLISLFSSFVYLVVLKGKNAIKSTFLYTFSLVFAMALLNPLFNHQGITILTYLPGGNPLTFESIIYGIGASIMLCNVINWFFCYNEIMTSDKLIYLFGKIIPTFSLVFSMTLKFIPDFQKQLKEITNSQKCIGNDISKGNIIKRIKTGLHIVLILITRSFENSIDTADSMKSRGYGTKKRTSYSNYKFTSCDILIMLLIITLSIIIIIGKIFNLIDFEYFPKIIYSPVNAYSLIMFIAYFLLSALPIIVELLEAKKWKFTK